MIQMELRERITSGLKASMKNKEAERTSTLRLINAAIKDKDIALRGEGRGEGVTEAEILAILGKMVKQRIESARTYEEAGRLELAEREQAEIEIIEEYLPKQLDDGEIEEAIGKAIKAVGAESIRDMGKVIGTPKEKYTGQMDFGQVGPLVKERLSG